MVAWLTEHRTWVYRRPFEKGLNLDLLQHRSTDDRHGRAAWVWAYGVAAAGNAINLIMSPELSERISNRSLSVYGHSVHDAALAGIIVQGVMLGAAIVPERD